MALVRRNAPMNPKTSMAPAEWIARRTIWGSLGPIFAADEHAPVG